MHYYTVYFWKNLQPGMKINPHLIPSACHVVDLQFLVLMDFDEGCVTVSGAHGFSLLSPRQWPAFLVEFQKKFKADQADVRRDKEFYECLWILQIITWQNRRNLNAVVAKGWLHRESIVDLGTYANKVKLEQYHATNWDLHNTTFQVHPRRNHHHLAK